MSPTIDTDSMTVNELVAIGTIVGTLVATDPANFTIANFSWASVDTPNAFAVSRAGVVTVSSVVDSLFLGMNKWLYSVSVCNPFVCGIYPLSIIVVQVSDDSLTCHLNIFAPVLSSCRSPVLPSSWHKTCRSQRTPLVEHS